MLPNDVVYTKNAIDRRDARVALSRAPRFCSHKFEKPIPQTKNVAERGRSSNRRLECAANGTQIVAFDKKRERRILLQRTRHRRLIGGRFEAHRELGESSSRVDRSGDRRIDDRRRVRSAATCCRLFVFLGERADCAQEVGGRRPTARDIRRSAQRAANTRAAEAIDDCRCCERRLLRDARIADVRLIGDCRDAESGADRCG